jgi:RNA polymerase sigma-70 factor (ECF subfamily)
MHDGGAESGHGQTLVEDLDTARLVARIQAGDRDAFAVLYMRYFDRVYSYLRLVLRNDADAEDAVQQVFTKVWEALPRYEHRRQPFRAWLFVIVRRYAINQLDRHARTEVVDSEQVQRELDAHPRADELPVLGWISDRELVLFIERLPLAQRQVLMLRYMLDLSNSEIAAVLGRSPEDVRSLQSRALRFLRERLDAVGRGADRPRVLMRRRVLQAPVIRQRRFALLP